MAYFPLTNYDFPNVTNYDGDLRELLQYVKELSDEYKEIDDLAKKLEDEFNATVALVEELQREVEDFRKEIADAVAAGIDAAMVEYEAKIEVINQRIDAANGRIDALTTLINDFTAIAKAYTDSEIETLSALMFAVCNDLQAQIDALQWTLPEVYNLVKGYKTDLVTLIYDVYDACRDNALTAYEFDVMGLTASELDALEMTAFEWDVEAKTKLVSGKCRNPFTGEMDTICNIIQQLALATTDQAITATEYDAAELTADEFEALNLTAYIYDFYAKQFIGA